MNQAKATTLSETLSTPALAAPRAEWTRLGTALVVLFFLVVGHIWSLDTGLFLDDHAHYAHLKEAPWTVQGLVEASRLGIVGDVMDLWGKSEAGLRFFRPVAFAIMKLEYLLVRWHPGPMHGLSLAWHFAACMLVGEVARRSFGRQSWATVAAGLMAIHPGHVATVYWIACQTELMTTVFLLVGLLAYGRYAGWGCAWFGAAREGIPADERARRGFRTSISAEGRVGSLGSDSAADRETARAEARGSLGALGRGAAALVALAAYALALGCRENAVLFPVICVAGDRLLVERERRRWRVAPVLMLGVLAAYFVLRHHYLRGFPMPARPYLYPPGDPGFVHFVIEKIVYYTIGMFGFIPVIPMGGQAYFASRPMAFYGGFASTLLILTIIWSAYRFRRPLVWPAIWTACTIAPVIPVFASSHHLYLPSVGAVLLLTAGLAALGGYTRIASRGALQENGPSFSPSHPPPPPLPLSPSENCAATVAAPHIPRPQAIVCGLVLLLHAVGLGFFTWGQGFAFRAGTRTEDILIADILRRSTPIRDGDHFYFINMPILAYYAIPALESELGWSNAPAAGHEAASSVVSTSATSQPAGTEPARKKLHGHVLTFSPWLMRMEQPGRVDVLDAHRLRVRAPDDARYFGGVTGHTMLQAMNLPTTLRQGEPIRDEASGFTVTPTEVDDQGVREFIFTFDRPLNTPGYHFLFGSPQFLGYPVPIP